MNPLIVKTNSARKFLDFVESSIFLWPAKNSKIAWHHVVARPSSGENGTSAVVTSTQEQNVLRRHSHFTVVAVLLEKNLLLKCLRGALQAVAATQVNSAPLYSIFW